MGVVVAPRITDDSDTPEVPGPEDTQFRERRPDVLLPWERESFGENVPACIQSLARSAEPCTKDEVDKRRVLIEKSMETIAGLICNINEATSIFDLQRRLLIPENNVSFPDENLTREQYEKLVDDAVARHLRVGAPEIDELSEITSNLAFRARILHKTAMNKYDKLTARSADQD